MPAETDAQIVLRRDSLCSNCHKEAGNPDHIFCGYCGAELSIVINGDLPRHPQAELAGVMRQIFPLIGITGGRMPKSELRPDDDFAKTLGFDWISPSSMDARAIDFIMRVEENFDIPRIPESELKRLATVRDLCDYILTLRGSKTD